MNLILLQELVLNFDAVGPTTNSVLPAVHRASEILDCLLARLRLYILNEVVFFDLKHAFPFEACLTLYLFRSDLLKHRELVCDRDRVRRPLVNEVSELLALSFFVT